MVYFICGHRGCGKSYLINQICKERICHVFDTGPILRNSFKNLNLDVSFSDWIKINEEKEGRNFTNKIICQSINLNEDDVNIIIGNRSMDGINYILDYFNIEDYKIVYIDGDYELFRVNYNMRENKNLNVNEFNAIIDFENSMGIRQIEYFVKNNYDKCLYFYKKCNNDDIFNAIMFEMSSLPKIKIKKIESKGEKK